ncbi:MAG TPA: amino acid adenylation domain-containing protein, partial [Longimicrobiaceae bacterium]|nr:amino acid adenylation domain-containing protein [Longimicrobiaceae bacterium]
DEGDAGATPARVEAARGEGGDLRIAWTVRRAEREWSERFRRELTELLEPLARGTLPGGASGEERRAALPAVVRDCHPAAEEAHPLAPLQPGILFHELLEPASGAYVIQNRVVLEREIDEHLFERAWEHLVRRHPALRSCFFWEGVREPLQVVLSACDLPLVCEDWSGLPPDWREERSAHAAEADRNLPFDPGAAPLYRARLCRLEDDRHELLLTYHHLVLDGWSCDLLVDDLLGVYEVLEAGREPPPPAFLPLARYVAWTREQDGAELEAFWRRTLPERVEPTLLVPGRPTERLPQRAPSYREVETRLAPEAARSLAAAGQRLRVTPGTLLTAAWALLLSRYARQETVTFGTTVSGRDVGPAGVETVVGVLVNTVPLRVRLPGEARLDEWLAAFQSHLAEVRRHAAVSLGTLRGWIEISPSLPIFESIAIVEDGSGAPRAGARPRPAIVRLHDRTRNPLVLEATLGEEVSLRIVHDAGVYDDETAGEVAARLAVLLERLSLAGCDTLLRELTLLTAEEEHRVLHEWNRTGRPYPLHRTFPELFAEQAARAPHAVAVLDGEDGRSLTYGELDRRSGRLAHALLARGVVRGSVVAVYADRGADFLAALIGVLRAGGVYLPIDTTSPPARVSQMIARSGCGLVLASRAHLPAAGRLEAGRDLPPPRVLAVEALLEESHPEHSLGPCSAPDDLAYILFTSGSTGTPKGAMIEHAGMLNHLFAKVEELGLSDSDMVAQNASQSFDISVWQFLAALLVGGRVRIYDDAVARDPHRLFAAVDREGVTVLEVVPSLMRPVLNDLDDLDGWRLQLRALRWLIPTGEALPVELCRRWLARYPSIPLLNAYGPTECSDDVSHHPVRVPPGPHEEVVPIGRPIPNLRLYVLDHALAPVPPGMLGELCVGGVGVGRGYVGNEEQTARGFLPDPFFPGGRLYRTGDLARWRPDGTLELAGRADHQVKVRGFRIELGEIERVLERHPGVGQAVVLARGDPESRTLVGFYTPGRTAAGGDEIRRFLAEALPPYMIPGVLTPLEAMPLMTNGKVDRGALLRMAEQGGEERRGRAPAGPVESQVAGVWKQVLGVEEVGAEDDFFEVGGSSLTAAQVVFRTAAVTGVAVPLRDFLESPTVAGLARAVEEGRSAPAAEATDLAP